MPAPGDVAVEAQQHQVRVQESGLPGTAVFAGVVRVGVRVVMPMGMRVAVRFRRDAVLMHAVASGMRMLDRRRCYARKQYCRGEQQRQPSSQTTLSHKTSDWYYSTMQF